MRVTGIRDTDGGMALGVLGSVAWQGKYGVSMSIDLLTEALDPERAVLAFAVGAGFGGSSYDRVRCRTGLRSSIDASVSD